MLRGDPLRAVGREAARRDEQMDVGMVEHRARPGVEHGETADLRADIARIGGQPLEGRRRAAQQHAVDDALVREREGAQRLRQGEGHEIVRAWQELRPLRLQPALGVRPVTRRAMPIAAGVIAEHLGIAVITLREVAAEVRSPARREIPEDARLAGEQPVLDVGAVRRAVEADDRRHRRHAGLAGRSGETVDEVRERIGECGADLQGQVGVDLRGARGAVPEDLLND